MSEIPKFVRLTEENARLLFSKPLWRQEEAIVSINGVDFSIYCKDRDRFWGSCSKDFAHIIRQQQEALNATVRMHGALKCAIDVSQPNNLHLARVEPNDFLRWAYEKGFEICQLLIDARAGYISELEIRKTSNPFGEATNWQKKCADLDLENRSLKALVASLESADSLNPKIKTSLQKLVLGMAIEKYGFDPNQERNSATAKISNDLARNGIELTDKTILSLLREASQALL